MWARLMLHISAMFVVVGLTGRAWHHGDHETRVVFAPPLSDATVGLSHTTASQPYSISLLWCCWSMWLLMWVFVCVCVMVMHLGWSCLCARPNAGESLSSTWMNTYYKASLEAGESIERCDPGADTLSLTLPFCQARCITLTVSILVMILRKMDPMC